MRNQAAILDLEWRSYRRWLLLFLVLFCFARTAWGLDAKNLWWDESLTLQRAESDWPTLLIGRIVLSDGQNQKPTIDQHPPLFFAIEGLFVRLAGKSEFVLRLPALMAATLLVPMTWALARLLARNRVLPTSAPIWAALLVSVNPFYLWYGQEARMYTLVPLLALLSTYLLLRWAEEARADLRRRFLSGYIVSLILLLLTHYLALLLVPVQAIIVLQRLLPTRRRQAVAAAVGIMALGAVEGLAALALVSRAPPNQSNFALISLRMLLPDLLNAFSMGLSVDIDQVRYLDYLVAILAILGVIWPIWSGRTALKYAWVLPAFLVIPVLSLQVIQFVTPAYMNARHMSLISGALLLLVSGGLGWAWQYRRWAGGALGAILLVGIAVSTANYFDNPRYNKDDFAGLGAYLRSHLQPGDAVVVVPSEMARLYEYYLPRDLIEEAARRGQETGWQAMPLYAPDPKSMPQRLAALSRTYRRIWLVSSGMVPLNPNRKAVFAWFNDHALQVRSWGYHANTNLTLRLFLPESPVLNQVPANLQHPLNTTFGDQVRLAGYDVGTALAPGTAVPVTLYWQSAGPIARHYKYILRLVSDLGGGKQQTLAITEREPYEGTIPTVNWQPGQTIREYSELPVPTIDLANQRGPQGNSLPAPARPGDASLYLTLQMYDADTLEKLPIRVSDDSQVGADGETLILPYAP